MIGRVLAVLLALGGSAMACGDGDGARFSAVELGSGVARAADDLDGTPALLAGWATWCLPCERELPALEAALPELSAAGVRVIAVNVDGPSAEDAAVSKMIGRLAPSLEVWRDEGSTLLGEYDGFLMPFSVLIDADGEVVRTWNGALEPDDVVPSLSN